MTTSNFYRSQKIVRSLQNFQTYFGILPLRPYQLEAAQAVIQSVLARDGETFVWKFARQGGKDETLAALYIYLMTLFSRRMTSIVAAAPTYKPQTELAARRLEERLRQNIVLKRAWGRRFGHSFNIRRSSITFFSADHAANVVGATADPLLVINEAQDVSPALYDKRFAPMAANNNATRLFSGTAWTGDTLLAREEKICRLREEQDGRKRVFQVDGYDIAAVHPPYGRFLEDQVARMGLNHPIIRTQYFCEEIDAQSAMFNQTRMALIFSDRLHVQPSDSSSHPRAGTPDQSEWGALRTPHAFLIDVAGQDETAMDPEGLGNPGRDSTTLSIVEVDLSTLEVLQAPTYRVVMRHSWTGENHLAVFGILKGLARVYNPRHIVIDATGVGEGLWAMLDKAFPTRVIPVKFSRQVKSEIGWMFLSIIETGRFQDCSASLPPTSVLGWGIAKHVGAKRRQAGEGVGVGWEGAESRISPPLSNNSVCSVDSVVNPDTVRLQYAKCESSILPGPQKTLRWGVPDGTRGPDGQLVHDDFLLADSLVAVLDKLEWVSYSPTLIIPARDPLEDMDRNF